MFLFSRRLSPGALALATALSLTGLTSGALAKEPAPSESLRAAPVLSEISLSELPAQAEDTFRRIQAGGPFPHSQDGVVFGNRERLLPRHARGFYREYTVETPGARNRGARRLICGGTPVTAPEVCYYTGDHYASFQRIRAAAGR